MTTSEPTVSVITISFRDLSGLQRTIDSTRTQSYPHIEHLVIDGGSGEAVLSFLKSAELDYWQSRPDGGRYDAMNQGIAHVRGDLLWFMHSSDTFSDRDAIAAVAQALSGRDARTSWGYGHARFTGADPRSGRVWGYTPFDMRGFALGTRPIPHQAAFFGIDLLERIGPYSTQFGLAADHLLMLAAAVDTPPVVLDRVLCNFDTSGLGSIRPQHEHFTDVRQSWDVAGYYPVRGRAVSLATSRLVEWNARAKARVRSEMNRRGITV